MRIQSNPNIFTMQQSQKQAPAFEGIAIKNLSEMKKGFGLPIARNIEQAAMRKEEASGALDITLHYEKNRNNPSMGLPANFLVLTANSGRIKTVIPEGHADLSAEKKMSIALGKFINEASTQTL